MMDRFTNEPQRMDSELYHQFHPRLKSKFPLDVLSENLLSYLEGLLDDDSLSYLIPLQPLYKGYERLLFSLQLSTDSSDFSTPLILRLYQHDISYDFVEFESSVQQAMLTEQFPVPRIFHICKDRSILGGYFILMEQIKGKNLNEYIMKSYHTITTISKILARTQIQLHRVNLDTVMNLLNEKGIDVNRYTFDALFEELKSRVSSDVSPDYKPIWNWLIENKPKNTDQYVICHSDLHFGNIIYDQHAVTGVVDWGKTRFCEAEYDIAATLILLDMSYRWYTYSPKFIISTLRRYLFWMYLSEYRKHKKIDTDKLQYYKALISFHHLMLTKKRELPDTLYKETLEFYQEQLEKSMQYFQ